MMEVKLQKWGNSVGIRLPKFIVDDLKLKINGSINLEKIGEKIVLSKVTFKDMTLEERFEGYDGDYEPEEIDWGKPVGKEIW